jgi:hypothetical protein
MRPTCLDCTRKHLSQAYVLLEEYASDPEFFEVFFWYAMGHLAEAETECRSYSNFSRIIRAHRRMMEEDDEYWIDFEPLIKIATRYAFMENGDEVDTDELEALVKLAEEEVEDFLCCDQQEIGREDLNEDLDTSAHNKKDE